jgi:ATPase subunit of ABC transporter with duplicated ATPase domains
MEKERLEAARRAEEEKLRKMEEERIARERAAEAERIRRDQEEARRAAAAASAAESQSYVNKTVKFIFRRSVDPNITTRIHEIIKATIDYYGKEKIFLKIRASIPDNQTVCLEFLQLPSGEMELLSNIIKILGNSGLGIAKAIVE